LKSNLVFDISSLKSKSLPVFHGCLQCYVFSIVNSWYIFLLDFDFDSFFVFHLICCLLFFTYLFITYWIRQRNLTTQWLVSHHDKFCMRCLSYDFISYIELLRALLSFLFHDMLFIFHPIFHIPSNFSISMTHSHRQSGKNCWYERCRRHQRRRIDSSLRLLLHSEQLFV
jgi:hypothetical protein